MMNQEEWFGMAQAGHHEPYAYIVIGHFIVLSHANSYVHFRGMM